MEIILKYDIINSNNETKINIFVANEFIESVRSKPFSGLHYDIINSNNETKINIFVANEFIESMGSKPFSGLHYDKMKLNC